MSPVSAGGAAIPSDWIRGAITFERKIGPFVYGRRSISLDDVQGVSSAGDCLVFYLGGRVLPLVTSARVDCTIKKGVLSTRPSS